MIISFEDVFIVETHAQYTQPFTNRFRILLLIPTQKICPQQHTTHVLLCLYALCIVVLWKRIFPRTNTAHIKRHMRVKKLEYVGLYGRTILTTYDVFFLCVSLLLLFWRILSYSYVVNILVDFFDDSFRMWIRSSKKHSFIDPPFFMERLCGIE